MKPHIGSEIYLSSSFSRARENDVQVNKIEPHVPMCGIVKAQARVAALLTGT